MEKERKIGPIIILIGFIVIICFSWLLWIFFEKYVNAENHENRTPASKPVFNLDGYADYADSFDLYFNDNMPFRNNLVSLNSKIDFFIFDKSTSDSVIKGKDGWLFFAKTLSDYQKYNLYTDEQLEEIKNNVLVTEKYFEERGIQFAIFIGPNKSSIYGDYMPDRYETNDGASRTDQVVEYLRENTDVNIIYPKEELLEAREKYPELILYQKLDTHWNFMGGYFGTKPLLESLDVNVSDFFSISYELVNEPVFYWNGYDMANMLGLSDVLNNDYNYNISGFSDNVVNYEGDTRNNVDDFNGAIRTTSDAADDRKVFFARDSYGEAMTQYLAQSFSEVYSVHRGSMTISQIEQENPDIFIYEVVERDADLNGVNIGGWAQ